MELNFLTSILLILTLFVTMLGMGISLTLDDFKRVLIEPKGVIFGLIAQLIMLPLVGFILANIFYLSPELAVGLMILTACPGGPLSNVITYLVKGNVALSITLTAVSSLITIFSIPLIVNFSMKSFMGQGVTLELNFVTTVLQITVVTLIPISIGMLLRYHMFDFAIKVQKIVKWLALFFLAVMIVGLLVKERNNYANFFLQVGTVTLALNILTMALGYSLSTLFKLDQASSKSITAEVGIQNAALAMAIASSPTLLNMPTMAIPAAVYGFIMYVTGAAFVWITGAR
ncbi:MAG: bile acid:sodium symporter family protein [Symploca sp. SIO2D2]|nr:bile acid:sodium symporter family protein [Symploca sp. SIO2D2]